MPPAAALLLGWEKSGGQSSACPTEACCERFEINTVVMPTSLQKVLSRWLVLTPGRGLIDFVSNFRK
jgi:hypothetical protein